ncbi:DUF2759 domain-containing protein [Bacillus fonticola]|uniref:DUF2759 domain-containing protein n=1 Tax=Bacillus fonticola TaxID=2728853 RepID=UPI0014739353|nr:DUF2759 domain-containing protein [Bacillus fonticola]
MGTAIIFALVAIVAAAGSYRTLKEKNLLGFALSFTTLALFGWFSIMTFINSGWPAA